jgi:hypothetical protein
MTRLYDYQRPPRGGGGECRPACQRIPLRGRRRCAAGGRQRMRKGVGGRLLMAYLCKPATPTSILIQARSAVQW